MRIGKIQKAATKDLFPEIKRITKVRDAKLIEEKIIETLMNSRKYVC